MSLLPTVSKVPPSVAASTSDSDRGRNRVSPASAATSSTVVPPKKLRSCVVCRSRRVRCDKQSPCSNCRRAGVACVYPDSSRPPRWARRFERHTSKAASSNGPATQDADPNIGNITDRLGHLESLIRELRDQLEPAQAASLSPDPGSPELSHESSSATANTSGVQKQFGRLVLQDARRSRYISSGFWSEVNDQLDLLMNDTRALAEHDTESSEDEASPPMQSLPSKELNRTASERNAFLFQHNLSPVDPDLRNLHPPPSQIPFILDIFSENVNIFIQVVHVPTVAKMIRNLRSSETKRLTTSNEALMFSIYYATITSMEEEDIMANFGSSKGELSLQYRLGLEYALAKADFLNAPDLTLVQALALFLCLVRRHDSPRYVWMMTGLVIRMAQYLGLQRDGSHFKDLSPFEIEARRKVWWVICQLDLRSAEDQGTDLSIADSSFDTSIPLNLNDADIDPDTKEMPMEREGVTDLTFARVNSEMSIIMRQMTSAVKKGKANLEEQNHMLDDLYKKCEDALLQYTGEFGSVVYWVVITIARLVKSKMTLIVFLPILFSSPSEYLSEESRTKLLVAAIEVAECNHSLNAEKACRQWRWVYQTYTHWHAIVYLLIEIPRRPWSPIVERAWVALHSRWLIPAQHSTDQYLRIWIPLRKLMAKARKHRDTERSRLRADPAAAAALEEADQKFPIPSSSGPFPAKSAITIYRERWRQLMTTSDTVGHGMHMPAISGAGVVGSGEMVFMPTYLGASEQETDQSLKGNIEYKEPNIIENFSGESIHTQLGPNFLPTVPSDQLGYAMGYDFDSSLGSEGHSSNPLPSSLGADSVDVNMDFDSDVDWHTWIESVMGLERDTGAFGTG